MITDINLQLDVIDNHLENIREITFGLSDTLANAVLNEINTASDALDRAYSLIIANNYEGAMPPWDT